MEAGQSLVENLEGYLQRMVEAIEAEKGETAQPARAGRKPVLPALALWSAVLVGMLRGFRSQAEIWRLVSWRGVWHYPASGVSDQAVYNRLANGEDQTLQKLFMQVRDGLREYLADAAQTDLAPFASGVYAIDGSTLDQMRRMVAALRDVPAGDSRLLAGKMVGVFDIRRQQWHEMLHLSNPNQNDKVVAAELVSDLPSGSLVLGDLGFFSHQWFDQLSEAGHWWVSRLRDNSSYTLLHTYYSEKDTVFDGLVWLGAYRADRTAHVVRLVTFRHGKQTWRYLTNVLDPSVLSLHDIAALYARRWDIELAFKMLKQHLNLGFIWSATPTVILQQLWAALVISQLLHAVQFEIARRANVDPFDVSLELLVRYVPQLTAEGKNPVEMIVADGRKFGFIRRSRRIRPHTPAIDHLQFNPLPPNLPLQRKPRYPKRRGRPAEAPPIVARAASGGLPRLC